MIRELYYHQRQLVRTRILLPEAVSEPILLLEVISKNPILIPEAIGKHSDIIPEAVDMNSYALTRK